MNNGLPHKSLDEQLAAIRAEHETALDKHRRLLEEIAIREFERMASNMRAANELAAEIGRTCNAIERDLKQLRSWREQSWAVYLLSGVGVMGLGAALTFLAGLAWIKLLDAF